MEDINKLQDDIKNILSKERYEHSVSTMKMCGVLAKKYGVDIEKAKIAGILHDMAKELKKEEIIGYIERKEIEADEIEKRSLSLLHGKIASVIAKKKYNIPDDIAEAISAHTEGKENMSLLDKIVFVADKIENTRDYEGVEEFRKLAMIDIDETIIKILDRTIKRTIEKRRILHMQSIITRNSLLINLEK